MMACKAMELELDRITFRCDGCGREFAVPASFAGRRASCKSCGRKLVVPQPGEPVGDSSAADAESAHSPKPSITGKASATPKPLQGTPLRERASSPPVVSEGQVEPILPTAAVSRPTPLQSLLADRPASPAPGAPRIPMRTRRLLADAQQMKTVFTGSSVIRVLSAQGDPPEIYQVEYNLDGLQRGWFGKPKVRSNHKIEIRLISDYPRLSPQCRMLTPIFHPNIDRSTICVGDHWTAGERLVDLVVRIGEMISYQAYNIKSPLDGEAAMWADLHPQRLPIDSRNLHAEKKDSLEIS